MSKIDRTSRSLRAWELVLRARSVDLAQHEQAELTSLQESCTHFPHKRQSIDDVGTQCGECGAYLE